MAERRNWPAEVSRIRENAAKSIRALVKERVAGVKHFPESDFIVDITDKAVKRPGIVVNTYEALTETGKPLIILTREGLWETRFSRASNVLYGRAPSLYFARLALMDVYLEYGEAAVDELQESLRSNQKQKVPSASK